MSVLVSTPDRPAEEGSTDDDWSPEDEELQHHVPLPVELPLTENIADAALDARRLWSGGRNLSGEYFEGARGQANHH